MIRFITIFVTLFMSLTAPFAFADWESDARRLENERIRELTEPIVGQKKKDSFELLLEKIKKSLRKSYPDVHTMTNVELTQFTGTSLLLVVGMCPGTALFLTASAVGETLPVVPKLVTKIAEVRTQNNKHEFDAKESKTLTSVNGGLLFSLTADLFKVGYDYKNGVDIKSQDEIFKNTQTTFAATTALANQFYNVDGECGIAGRNLVNALTEIIARKK